MADDLPEQLPAAEDESGREPPVEPVRVAAPGFYPDPKNPDEELYWDGDKWTSESVANAPDPGFYTDPNDPKVERYWDGRKWTDSRQSVSRQPGALDESPGVDVVKQDADGVIIAGYVFAVLIPPVGFIIGLTQINRNRHGIWVVVVSAVAFVITVAILGGDQNNGFNS